MFILAAVPQYVSSINSKIRNIERRGEEVNCDELIEFICDEWRIGRAGKNPIFATEDGKTSLSDFANVTCNYCQKTGHLRKDCPDVVCKFPGCGKTGHHTDKCWRDPKNANTCPQWLKGKMAAKKTASERRGVKIIVPYIIEDNELADWPNLPESAFW